MTLLPTAPAVVRPTAPTVALPAPVPLPFHRLGRTGPRPRWWRPLLVLLVAAASYAVLGTLALVALLVLDHATGSSFTERATATSLTDPVTFGFGFGSIALMMPALLLARWLVGPRPVGLVASVAGAVRWRRLGAALWRAAVVHLLALVLLVFVVGPARGEPAVLAPRPGLLALLALAMLLVPFQAAAEELVFRGWAMQAVGTWVRHPAFAVLLPVPFFVAGHPYDVWGQLEVGVFAVVAGWLAWRTGGLEAPIALHVVNNVLLSTAAALGYADLDATAGSPLSLGASTVITVVAGCWMLRAFRTTSLTRVR